MHHLNSHRSDEHNKAWNDSVLLVSGEPVWRAQYRLLQSWYREQLLGAPPGMYQGKLRGNHLPASWLADHPDANFLTPEVAGYVDIRVPQVLSSGGTLDETRLRSNLLSSMPLCFNLFGQLRANMDAAATPLAHALELDIAKVDLIEVEWAPPPELHLKDRTAFDAYLQYRTSNGERGFVGIETKYTEKFSAHEYDSEVYRELTASEGSGFKAGAPDVLKDSLTNQLWRNAMLVVSHRRRGEFRLGHVAVVHCEGDTEMQRAISAFSGQLTDPPTLLREASLESIVDQLSNADQFAEFSARFRQRYLDLSPVQ